MTPCPEAAQILPRDRSFCCLSLAFLRDLTQARAPTAQVRSAVSHWFAFVESGRRAGRPPPTPVLCRLFALRCRVATVFRRIEIRFPIPQASRGYPYDRRRVCRPGGIVGKERGKRGRVMIYHPPIYGLSNASKSTELRFMTDIARRAAETTTSLEDSESRAVHLWGLRFDSQGRDHPPMGLRRLSPGGCRGKANHERVPRHG
jgi:hypothetical protein